MSDPQKPQRSGAAPIKNPLLSASVTGLTFDDFPNKPLLLPAAPAIAYSPVPVSSSVLIAREPKSLVTVGSSSLDTEALDEINLNSSNDDNQLSDANANPLLEQINQDVGSDSILSQAASSFSALPSVASNVFSTFSKRITAISNSRETTPTYDPNQRDSNANTPAPQLDIQPAFIQADLGQAAPRFYATSLGGNSLPSQEPSETHLPPKEPPKFYIPAEVPPVPSITATPPTSSGGQNNFRLSAKKKLYAPIPGLSDQGPKPTTTLNPVSYDPSQGSQTASTFYSQPPYSTVEEEKLGSGLFSKISNLAPTGVLQNITGLVQSAAGSLTQTTKADYHQAAAPAVFDQQNSFFPAPVPPTNYFVPPQVVQINTESYLTRTEQGNAQASTPGTSQLLTSQHNQPISGNFSQTQIPLLDSSKFHTQINPSSSFQSTPASPYAHSASSSSTLSSTQLPPSEQPVTTYFPQNKTHPTESSSITTSQITFFDPTKYLPPAPSSQTGATDPTNVASHSLPPFINQKTAPPVAPASAYTSYRLQKGTKLYKSPLTPQETAPLQVTPNQIQSVKLPQSVPLFAPPPVGEQTLLQSVPFIAPPANFAVESAGSNQSAQSVPLFVPAPLGAEPVSLQTISVAEDLKSNEIIQTPSLFPPSKTPTQNYSLFSPQVEESKIEDQTSGSSAPPLKKLKSNESVRQVQIEEAEKSSFKETTNTLESFENKFETEIRKQASNSDIVDDKETQAIFEPIEPIFEENISETLKRKFQDPLEETLQKLSLAEAQTGKLPPIGQSFNLKNPYRRGSGTETAKTLPTLPVLANFFTPEPFQGSANLNFFADLPSASSSTNNAANFFSGSVHNKENSEPVKSSKADTTKNFFTAPLASELAPLEPYTTVQPPISAFFPTRSQIPTVSEDKDAVINHLNENLPPLIGFERFMQSEADLPSIQLDDTALQQNKTTVQHETTNQTEQPEVVNRFVNYFNQTNQQPEIPKDSSTFFDSLLGQQQQLGVTAPPSVPANEEQRIQNFFNNPPPKDASKAGDLNYDLVHNGLGIKNLQQRSLTSISNLVEPPSSACSEFSEIGNSSAGQKSFAANLSLNESSDQLIAKEETNKSITEESTSGIINSYVKYNVELPEKIILNDLEMANLLSADKSAATSPMSYKPAVKHWFYKSTINDKKLWVPFSHYDSALLETSLLMENDERTNIVAVEGGRYDVNISERKKMSVYWDSEPIEVRRCSWFYKGIDSKYVPYEEQTADLLESEYKQAAESGVWHKDIILGEGEKVVFHGPTVIVHFQKQQNADAWGGTTQTASRPRVVKRDLDDFNIEPGESQKVDHLLFMVHGIGSVCDLKLRSVEEVVEDFRTIARQLVQSHYKNSTDLGLVGRVEVLPISWHSHLHSVEMGIDEKLRMITLESIPKLRNFTNDTLLDILFYTSPTFCQKIMNTIVSSLNTLYLRYRQRHPEFNGGVSLAGHSLGSLILFDLLCHQNPIKESEEKNLENPNEVLAQMDSNQLEDKQVGYTVGPAGTGQPFINYDQLIFQPKKFFALGSPIGMFVTIRGIDKLGLDFRLPTCPGFYNIFHPYDPVAYRIEALVNPDLSGVRPVLIPHHKGRKRMHLELKETMTRVSMDLKNRFLDKFKNTLESVNIFGSTSKSAKEAEELMEKEVDKVIQMQMQFEQRNDNKNANDNLPSGSEAHNEAAVTPRKRTDSTSTAMSDEMVEIDFPLGKLNDSKRIDYVLQEAPLEFINEYIFALSSHVCYWDSEDTILFVMKEIYAGLGISPDSQVPQQTMTIERPSSRNSLLSSS